LQYLSGECSGRYEEVERIEGLEDDMEEEQHRREQQEQE